MCLYNNPKNVRQIIQTAKKKKRKFIWAYKLVYRQNNILSGHWRGSYIYKIGWNKSNSQSQKPNLKFMRISRGIHVYRNRPNDYDDILKVKCYIKDLIGEDYNEMVFRKIYIPESEYKRATCT